MTFYHQTRSPSPLSGRSRKPCGTERSSASAPKPRGGASGLIKKLFTLNLARKVDPPETSRYNPRPYPQAESSSCASGQYERDTLVQRVSEALLSMKRHARADSVSSISSYSSSGTPGMDFDSASGTSTPLSSGVCTPVTPGSFQGSPASRKFKRERRASHGSNYSDDSGIVIDGHNTRHLIFKEPTQPYIERPVARVEPVREPLALIDISCQPYRRPLKRPARSKASVLRAALCQPPASTPRPMFKASPPASVSPPLFKLPPLPRYNPYVRPRAESLSSAVCHKPDQVQNSPKYPSSGSSTKLSRRNSTLSGLWTHRKKPEMARTRSDLFFL
ncbi:unnamed protein product [Somion occarium]|uniref:Uncharacterized protein n=1 Tax=Somion occarium TaxID=3059160 RepID=A0ABP1CGY8_9APHY